MDNIEVEKTKVKWKPILWAAILLIIMLPTFCGNPTGSITVLVILLAIGILFGLPCILFIMAKAGKQNRLQKGKEFFQRIEIAILAHIQTLARKRAQTVYKDDYGRLITKAWEKEKEYFIDSVLRPQFPEYDKAESVIAVLYLNPLTRLTRLYRNIDTEPEEFYMEFRSFAEPLIEKAIEEYNNEQNMVNSETDGFSDAMTPYDYEKYCADLLQKAGWEAKVTKSSGDQGVDVIAEKDGVRIALQCKLYTKPVGNKAIQEAFAAKKFENAQYAAVVTNQTYTASARQIAASTEIALLHHDELLNWVNSLV